MKPHFDITQGTPEWHELRMKNFTASELGPWAMEPVVVNITIDQAKKLLDLNGISYKKSMSKSDFMECLDGFALLPEPELCDGAKTAIRSKIVQGRYLQLKAKETLSLTAEECIWLDRFEEIANQKEKQFAYNIPVKYGKMLEPYAREWYEEHTGRKATECGFIEHDSGGFGCSPDGLVSIDGDEYGPSILSHGLEIKCPVPETHLEWLMDGKLPDDHKLQVHCSMAVTGLQRWDFLSYCPGEKPLLVTVHRDETTDKLEAGLKTLVAEKAKMKARLAQMWEVKP